MFSIVICVHILSIAVILVSCEPVEALCRIMCCWIGGLFFFMFTSVVEALLENEMLPT